jgi:hypothetical protein
VTWQRHVDGAEIWYVSSAGESVWDIPGGPDAVTWQKHSDATDTWFVSSAGETAWVLPPGAVLL